MNKSTTIQYDNLVEATINISTDGLNFIKKHGINNKNILTNKKNAFLIPKGPDLYNGVLKSICFLLLAQNKKIVFISKINENSKNIFINKNKIEFMGYKREKTIPNNIVKKLSLQEINNNKIINNYLKYIRIIKPTKSISYIQLGKKITYTDTKKIIDYISKNQIIPIFIGNVKSNNIKNINIKNLTYKENQIIKLFYYFCKSIGTKAKSITNTKINNNNFYYSCFYG